MKGRENVEDVKRWPSQRVSKNERFGIEWKMKYERRGKAGGKMSRRKGAKDG